MENTAFGPHYFKGKFPFDTRVVIETKMRSDAMQEQYITCVGFKKPMDADFDFVEMTPARSQAEAEIVHEKTCRFFSNSSLFRKMEVEKLVIGGSFAE
jgi:hypothetical protein